MRSLAGKRADLSGVVPFLEQMLDEAKRGEIKSLNAVIERPDGTFQVFRTADESPHETAGKLLKMAIHRVE